MQLQKRGLELGAHADLLNDTWNIFAYRSSVLHASSSANKGYEGSVCQKRRKQNNSN